MKSLLIELKETIEEFELTYDYERDYTVLYNECSDFMNETQTWDFEELFNGYVDYLTAEEITKQQLEEGGLIRLYYFLGDANLNNNIFKINGYGNLEDLEKSDLECLKSDILGTINRLIKDN